MSKDYTDREIDDRGTPRWQAPPLRIAPRVTIGLKVFDRDKNINFIWNGKTWEPEQPESTK